MLDFLHLGHRIARARISKMQAGELSSRGHARLRAHLRACKQCRTYYDRAMLVQRELESTEFSRCELAHVESLLFDVAASPAKVSTRRLAGFGLAAVAAACLVLVALPEEDDAQYWGQRGEHSQAPLSIEAYCGSPVRPARQAGCQLDEVLTFAYSLQESPASFATVAIFGVDHDGSVKYYAPTPNDRSIEVAARSQWTPVTFGTNLAVNHSVGLLRVFALASPVEASIADIDELAAEIHRRLPDMQHAQWHHNLTSPAVLKLCGDSLQDCASATLRFPVEESQ